MKNGFLFLILFVGVLVLYNFLSSESNIEEEKISVPEVLPLKLRYKVGETLYYCLVRENFNFKLDGRKSGGMKAVAYFTRTRLDDDNQGRVNEKFSWKGFWFGQTMTPGPVKMKEFEAGENFSIIHSVNDDEALSKYDFSSLPRTMDGFFFMILTWDAVTFDGMIRPTKYLPIPDETRVGAEFKETREPHDFVFEYPPLVTDSKYTFSGKSWMKILGVTTVHDIPCVIIEFANLENRVLMNIHLKPMEMRIQGFEHFWGKTYLSLEDGRIIRGELVGPITMIQDLQMPGLEKPEHTEFFTMGYLEMDLLSEEEFKAALKKFRKEWNK
jgi:hypothetical protein